MNIEYLILILSVIFVMAIITRYKKRHQNDPKKDKPNNSPEETDDLNEEFIKNLNDEEVVDAVKVFSPIDLKILRSVLASEGVNNYVLFPCINSLYAGIPISGYTDSIIQIKLSDKEEAVKIIKDYIFTRTQRSKDIDPYEGRNVIDFAAGGYAIPTAGDGNLPELLLEL